MHTYRNHEYMNTYTQAHSHTHTLTHTHMNTHIHTHVHLNSVTRWLYTQVSKSATKASAARALPFASLSLAHGIAPLPFASMTKQAPQPGQVKKKKKSVAVGEIV